jgi:hypothetical protein
MNAMQLGDLCSMIQTVSGISQPFDYLFEGDQSDNNLFARIVRGELPQWRVWEDDQHVAFLTPYANTPGFTVHFIEPLLIIDHTQETDGLGGTTAFVTYNFFNAEEISGVGFPVLSRIPSRRWVKCGDAAITLAAIYSIPSNPNFKNVSRSIRPSAI